MVVGDGDDNDDQDNYDDDSNNNDNNNNNYNNDNNNDNKLAKFGWEIMLYKSSVTFAPSVHSAVSWSYKVCLRNTITDICYRTSSWNDV